MVLEQVRYDNGDTQWRFNGKLHCENGPAVESSNGYREWWINGEIHREDGPAVEYSDGSKFWWIHGKRHREDGPAVEKANGDKHWYFQGKFHKLDGPALEEYRYKKWFIMNIQYTQKAYEEIMVELKNSKDFFCGTQFGKMFNMTRRFEFIKYFYGPRK
jgi:hypothetical protein